MRGERIRKLSDKLLQVQELIEAGPGEARDSFTDDLIQCESEASDPMDRAICSAALEWVLVAFKSRKGRKVADISAFLRYVADRMGSSASGTGTVND